VADATNTGEMAQVIRLKVGVSRKEATDHDGSVGATCEVEVEIPGGTPDAEVLRIRDHWLGLCEATVDEELDRLRGGPARPRSASSASARAAPPARSNPAPARAARPEFRGPAPSIGRRPPNDEDDLDDERHAPTDGRQLLGWAAKQIPDAKGLVISFGKRKDYPPKIVDWDVEQVMAAYRYARAHNSR
jgi:hypothetical protein